MKDWEAEQCSHEGRASWWEYDGRGIELCKVCDRCRKAKLARFRPEILRGYDERDVDEAIEADEWGP